MSDLVTFARNVKPASPRTKNCNVAGQGDLNLRDGLNSDDCIPVDGVPTRGTKYFVICIDREEKGVVLCPISNKSEGFTCFSEYLSMV